MAPKASADVDSMLHTLRHGHAVQAAAKAAAAAEAASAARAAQEEACSTYTHGDVVAAVDSQAHTSAEPSSLRRKSAVAVRFCTSHVVSRNTLHTHAIICAPAGGSCRWMGSRSFLLNVKWASCMQGEGDDAGTAAPEPEQAPVSARPRSASRANTPSLDTSDPNRKRGGKIFRPTCTMYTLLAA